jgi:hypothetical protein
MPRRSWQRRYIRRNAKAQGRGRELPHDIASGFSYSSDSESGGDKERSPVIQRVKPATMTYKRLSSLNMSSYDSESTSESEFDSDSDSKVDSGYGSLEEDPNTRADFYDELLERFRVEGPTLANHCDNTKKMIQDQEQKWIEWDAFECMSESS